MRKQWFKPLAFFSLFSTFFLFSNANAAEWTFLIFLNGNNNLDSFGSFNIKQMEQIGSTKDVNVVVEWASLQRGSTQRLFITQDTTHTEVTSHVVQDMGQIDMGDSKTLFDFIQWGVKQYPAKHYVIDVWNHGSGWHMLDQLGVQSNRSPMHATDISWDDNTGHSITTQQLGSVLNEAAKVIGHKIDLYASDACLMAMAEVAEEVANSVQTYAGSEEVEPGAGWPYNKILGRLTSNPEMSSEDLAKILTEEYVHYYNGGGPDHLDATFSAFNLSKITSVNKAIANLGKELSALQKEDTAKVLTAAKATQRFTSDDYADLVDFATQLEASKITAIHAKTLKNLKKALSDFIIATSATPSIPKSFGASIWLPTSMEAYSSYSEKYSGLEFQKQTQWGDALKHILQ